MTENIHQVLSVLSDKASEKLFFLRDTITRHCPIADREHDESIRQYMHVGCRGGLVICHAKAVSELNIGFIVGLLGHELGHLGLMALGFEEHTEDDANKMGEWLIDIPIFWRTWDGRKNLEWSPIC